MTRAAVGGSGPEMLTIQCHVHEDRKGRPYVKATLYATIAGRYGSQAVMTCRLPGDAMPPDWEAVIASVWPMLHQAVYSS